MSKDRTMTSATERLQREGYTDNIILIDGQLIDASTKSVFDLNKLTVDKIFRFDGDTDPADESILYGISSGDGHKGIFIEAFGTYDDTENEEVKKRFIKEIKRHNDESLWT